MKNKNKKFVMMSMFKNEAKTIGRMLESCYKYIDFWILQDNGSSDGTPGVVADFFKDKNIPGFIYQVAEGWVGFGWNRDHLVKTVCSSNHGCDWILKMDCDETLVVDDDFDWSVFDDLTVPSFHVPALANGVFYQRAWIYNATLPWRFNHDDAHETVYIEGQGEGFRRVDLPISFKHVTYTDGESYGVRTKYLSDALKFEEKLIREETLLTDRYHFWYIGKSYYDCFRGDFYPFGKKHSEEFARRSIFYFDEFVNVTHNYEATGRADRIDEMAYYAMMLNALTYRYLNNKEKSIEYLLKANDFAPIRNEHWMRLAEIYYNDRDFEKLYETTSLMLRPERVNPFPEYHFIIESDAYHNTGTKIIDLHRYAEEQLKKNVPTIVEQSINLSNSTEPEVIDVSALGFNLKVSQNMKKRLFIVDNFYDQPDEVRNFALSLEFKPDIQWYKGLRSTVTWRPDIIKEKFESIIGEKINMWSDHHFNGCFQITTAEDPQVYHHDAQKWAAMIYLTPDAPIESGTRLHRSKISGARHADDPSISTAFAGGFIDSTKFDVVDNAGNIFNRLVIMDAKCIHSAGPYFGTNAGTGRLIHLFFFD
jgi:glycosyltransferase involved in cell wall biosynthesis